MFKNNNNNRDQKDQLIHLLRQILVSSGVWVHFFMFGLCMGTPTIYISQTRREANSTAVITEEMSSWLSSTPIYSSVPNLFIIVALSTFYGPTKTFLATCLISALGFAIMYFSTSVVGVIIGEVVLGILISSDCIVCIRVLTEYISPQYRGSFLVIKSASFAWGMLIANLMGTFLHWRAISILGCVLAVYAFLSGLLWPESPYWLASKHKYTACTNSHYWLKGRSEQSEKELESLIEAHDNFVQSKTLKKRNAVIDMIKACFSKAFYKAFGYSVLLMCIYHFTGKMACNVYALQIIKSVTSSESTAYIGMIVMDALSVLSMYFISVVIKCFKRKAMFLCLTLLGIIFLFLLSLYLYLVKLQCIQENNFIFLALLCLYMVCVSCGPVSLSPSLIAELCPLNNRSLYMFLVTLCGNITMATVIKLVPLLFSSMGAHGAFLFYGLSSLFFIILIIYLVPETKDKTIVEMDALLRK